MCAIYKYTVMLRDGTKVEGSYVGNGEKQQAIKVDGVTPDNPVTNVMIHRPVNLSKSELKMFGSYCFYCDTKLSPLSKFGGWSETLVCNKCGAEVEIQQQDAMSGCLIDYTIVCKKGGITNTIDIPFKD